ncbi:hypothetical protein LINPERPRIM_LOCUS5645, partial [Linum perenne]
RDRWVFIGENSGANHQVEQRGIKPLSHITPFPTKVL